MRVHVDTDLGDNPDDACALAMLLSWPDVEVVSVTTVADPDGWRAGQVREVLTLAGRDDVPVLPGTGGGLGLLESAVREHTGLVALGPLSNLAALEHDRPGALARLRLTVSGGWLDDPGPALPRWAPARDTNIVADVDAARVVWTATTAAGATWVPVPVAAEAQLTTSDVERLADVGALGRHLAELSRQHARNRRYPPPLVNYLFDPVAVAVAVGWPGVDVRSLDAELRPDAGGWRFVPTGSPAARPTAVVTGVDAARFSETFLARLEVVFG